MFLLHFVKHQLCMKIMCNYYLTVLISIKMLICQNDKYACSLTHPILPARRFCISFAGSAPITIIPLHFMNIYNDIPKLWTVLFGFMYCSGVVRNYYFLLYYGTRIFSANIQVKSYILFRQY